MIRSMQVNRVASDLEAYAAAAQMFVDKYRGLPGDMTNATTFWSSTIVANGNGDGQINYAGAASTAGEMFGAWEQMALAGLIKGTYTGIAGSGSIQHSVPANSPKGPLSATGYSWFWWGNAASNAYIYDGYYGNAIIFGGFNLTSVSDTGALAPAEAYGIDLKIDDGVPGTGNISTYHTHTACNTGTATTGSTSTYITTSSVIDCNIIFKTGL
jgi:hypothetical protein